MSIQRTWVEDVIEGCGVQKESYIVRCDSCGKSSPDVVVYRGDSDSMKRGVKRLKELALDLDMTAVGDKHFCAGCYYEWERRGVPKTGTLFDLGPQVKKRG